MKIILPALLILSLPLSAGAQYYGSDPYNHPGNQAVQRQLEMQQQQLRHQERMMMEQNRQMQLDRMYQQQRSDNMRRNSSNDGLPGLPPLGGF